jgi:hypothetical protein
MLHLSIAAHSRKIAQLRRVSALCHYKWLLADRSLYWLTPAHTHVQADGTDYTLVGDYAHQGFAPTALVPAPASLALPAPAPGAPPSDPAAWSSDDARPLHVQFTLLMAEIWRLRSLIAGLNARARALLGVYIRGLVDKTTALLRYDRHSHTLSSDICYHCLIPP